MGTKKGKKSGKKTEGSKVDNAAEKVNLRTAAPAVRVRGQIDNATAKLDQILGKLKGWVETAANDVLSEVTDRLGSIVGELHGLDETLASLVASGWTPPRKSYTASTDEGDSVSVLDEHREGYADILAPAKQVELEVVKKYPGRGGGLVVQAKDGTRLKVSTSHVVRL